MKRREKPPAPEWSVWDIIRPAPDITCSRWVQENLDISADPTSPEKEKGFPLYKRPHLKDPLDFFSSPDGGKLTVMAVEQTGKSTIWKAGLIYRIVEHPAPVLIIYPSDDLGITENRDSLEPLMRAVPSLQYILETPFATSRDCYRLGDSIIHFCGSGSPVISQRAAMVIGDEINDWVKQEGKRDNIKLMDHRLRSYSDPRRVLVCSPKGPGGDIWDQYKRSSMGSWHLRCRGCGELTMRSSDPDGKFIEEEEIRKGGLQFELDPDTGEYSHKEALEDSIRLICPYCGKEHEQDKDAEWMNANGGYIHKEPKRQGRHDGYQWGALANIPAYFPALTWKTIADARLSAGSSGTMDDHLDYVNSFRGLPNLRKQGASQAGESGADILIRKHIRPFPPDDQINYNVLAVDTQDDGFWYVVRSVTHTGCTWLREYGKKDTMADIGELMKKDMQGGAPLAGIQDIMGHRMREVVPEVKKINGLLMYQGTVQSRLRIKGRQYRWVRQSKTGKLYKVDARYYLGELLFHIYRQFDDTRPSFYLGPDTGDDYVKSIMSYKPGTGRDGDHYENWISTDRNEHLADCEKMSLALMDIVSHQLTKVPRGKLKDTVDPVPVQKSRKPAGAGKAVRRTQRTVNRYET